MPDDDTRLIAKGCLVDASEASSLATAEGDRLTVLREEARLHQQHQARLQDTHQKLKDVLRILSERARMTEVLCD
jgi:hypothetical protein